MTSTKHAVSALLGVELGSLIDVALHDAVGMRFGGLMMPNHRDHYLLFASAWNGVGVRLKVAEIHASGFKRQFAKEPISLSTPIGAALGHFLRRLRVIRTQRESAASSEARFEQDARFFDCVANATAAAENVVFAAYLLSVFPSVPTDKALRKNRDDMVKQIVKASTTGPLGQLLQTSFNEKEALNLYELRDYLLHRGRPARNRFVGGDFDGLETIARNLKAHPSQWQNDLIFDGETLDAVLRWLTRHCEGAAKLMLQVTP